MKCLATIHLQYVYGSSSKFYVVALIENAGLGSVAFNYGRIGAPRGWAFKADKIDLAKAQTLYEKIVTEKTGEGYVEVPLTAALAYPGAALAAAAPTLISPGAAAPVAAARPIAADVPPRFPAQLAHALADFSAITTAPSNYMVEEKYDGMRGLIAFSPDGVIAIRNRYGEDKGRLSNAPALEAAWRALAKAVPELWAGSIIDGELVGRTWSETMHLLGSAGQRETGLRFVAFDLPYFDGRDLRSKPLRERRAILETLARSFQTPVELSRLMQVSPGLPEEIWARGGEGLVIKDPQARYMPGDRNAWGKLKLVETADVVIMGFNGGNGQFAGTTGSLRCGQYRNGLLVEVSDVSGMSLDIRRAIDASWLGRVIEISHGPRTAAGKYLFARWSRERPDKKAADCVW